MASQPPIALIPQPTATAWPTATAKMLLGTQIPTLIVAPVIPLAQYLHPSTANTDLAITPPRTQIPTPRTPQPFVAFIPQQAAPTASTFPPATALTPPPAAPPIPPAIPTAAPPATLIAALPATPIAAPPATPIAVPPATPIAAPTAPTATTTPPGPQSSNYDQLLWLREQQPQQLG